MGLDMYAEYYDGSDKNPLGGGVYEDWVEFFYWRKHSPIHNFMCQEWKKKGNEGVFNLVRLQLDKDMMQRLRVLATLRQLEPMDGFFFGNGFQSDETRDNDLLFVDKAIKLLDEGKVISYYASY